MNWYRRSAAPGKPQTIRATPHRLAPWHLAFNLLNFHYPSNNNCGHFTDVTGKWCTWRLFLHCGSWTDYFRCVLLILILLGTFPVFVKLIVTAALLFIFLSLLSVYCILYYCGLYLFQNYASMYDVWFYGFLICGQVKSSILQLHALFWMLVQLIHSLSLLLVIVKDSPTHYNGNCGHLTGLLQ